MQIVFVFPSFKICLNMCQFSIGYVQKYKSMGIAALYTKTLQKVSFYKINVFKNAFHLATAGRASSTQTGNTV